MNHSEIMELGALAIGGLALFVILSRGGSTKAAPVLPETVTPVDPGTPSYLSYNQSTTTAGNSAGLSPVAAQNGPSAAGSSQTPCACGSGPVNFSSLTDYSNFLAASNENFVEQYYDSVTAALPDFLGQFVNNTTAVDQSAAASGGFSSLAGQF